LSPKSRKRFAPRHVFQYAKRRFTKAATFDRGQSQSAEVEIALRLGVGVEHFFDELGV
jgi:hypothetical protein